MLNSIIRFSVKNKLVIGLLTIALVFLGIYHFQRLPIDAVPDITDNQVQVITVSPALGAPDVERLITFPVEQVNSNIPGLKEIRSFSRFGLSLVTLVFTDQTDVYWARQQVSERLLQVQNQIPGELGIPELAPVTTGLGEIYQYVLRPAPGFEKKYDAMELRTLQDWIVRRQLLGVKGVADISSFGGKLKQYEVAVDVKKLNSYGLSISELFKAISGNNSNTGGAYIEKGPTVLFIRTEGLVNALSDLEAIAVKRLPNGIPVLLKDVAEVRFGHANRYGAMTYNGEGEVAGGIVMMLKGANSSDVIKTVKERITQIEKSLPEGVILEPFLDRTKMVNNAIGTVEKNLLEGALIVLFVLVLFLGHLRAGLIVASVIPLSLLFAIIMMNVFGVSGNLMSLGALDFGLIVDGAVIIVEAIMHRFTHTRSLTEGRMLNQEEMNQEVISASTRMMNSAVFGQIIILIVYLPIFMLEGIEGKMFKPMAQTVAFALMGAFILSLTYVPMMSSLFLSKKISHKKTFSDTLMQKTEKVFIRTLDRMIRKPKPVLIGSLLAFAGSILLLLNMGGEFIPELEEGDLAVDTRVMTGSNLQTTIEATREAATLLRQKFPEVKMVVTKIGSGEIPTDPMPIEASDMMVILKDKKDWTSAKSFDELTEKMSHELQKIPGISAGFQYPVQMRFNELMTGARQDVVCKIFGEDLDTLTYYAEKLGRITKEVEGTRDLYVESMTGMPQIVIRYNRNALAQYGVNVQEVNKAVNAAFAGQSSGLVFEGERRFDLVIRLAHELRRDADDVKNLLIPAPDGSRIPLYQVADVEVKNGPNQIQREDAKRRITIGFNVRGRDVQSIVHELEEKAAASIKLPPGYYITYGGSFENLVEAKQRLSIAVPLALGLIFLLLYFAFGSLGQGLLIFSAIPLSAIGGVIALSLRGLPFSISAGIGFIALFGVAVLNGIVLLSEFNRLRKDGIMDPVEIVRRGTMTRLRPVLMTAAVASLGFLPMALSQGAGAEVQRPLATVVIGGLISATFLTLVLVPILYIRRYSMLNKRHMKKALVLILLLPAWAAEAQQAIPLSSALDSLISNPGIKARTLQAVYYNHQKKSSWEPGTTTVSGEFGQVNSFSQDQKFVISQGFELPFTYIRKSQVNQAGMELSGQQLREEQLKLTEQLYLLYTDISAVVQELELLKRADSVYTAYAERAGMQVLYGSGNHSDEAYANLLRGEWHLSYRQKSMELEKLNAQLTLLLHSPVPIIADLSGFEPENKLPTPVEDAELQQHPLLSIAQAEEKMAHARTLLEKAQSWPGISIGYFNQTIKGWQRKGDSEIYFDGRDRFDGVQLGLSLPLFYNFRVNRVNALKTEEAIAFELRRKSEEILRIQYREAYSGLHVALVKMKWYKEQGLPGARIIEAEASRRLQSGDIDFMQWALLTGKAMETQQNFFETERDYRRSLIHIHSFTGNLR